MIHFPYLEFVHAVALAKKATRRGDVKAAACWLRVAEQHMKLYSLYNVGAAEEKRIDAQRAADFWKQEAAWEAEVKKRKAAGMKWGAEWKKRS